jgi:hypothetical protein
MKTPGIAAGAVVCVAATSALAQGTRLPTTGGAPRDVAEAPVTPVRAPHGALELGVGAGYTQGFGAFTSDPRVGAGAGGTIGVGIGYRLDPRWSVGGTVQYQGYGSRGPEVSTLRGMTADFGGTLHLAPFERLDPYVNLSSGYRLFAESPAGNAPATLTHGIEIGKVKVGLDVRASESVAVSPVLGIDLDLFPWITGGAPAAMQAPSSRGVSTFIFAGVEGRFDVGGQRVDRPAP